MLSVPSNIINDIASTTSATVTGLLPVLAIFISVPLAFYFIKKVIALFPKK